MICVVVDIVAAVRWSIRLRAESRT